MEGEGPFRVEGRNELEAPKGGLEDPCPCKGSYLEFHARVGEGKEKREKTNSHNLMKKTPHLYGPGKNPRGEKTWPRWAKN